ncbi:hypothetical protein [Natronorubrum halophilum]|uniref:hypothetical protein n=1 Tax=Natronorubrum halophilum TaxID=1702106 RepID=UPI000EF65B6F|nr:hypothetical protein [Natronorubrum halophilum]
MNEKSETQTDQVEWEIEARSTNIVELTLETDTERVTFPTSRESAKEIGRALFEVAHELEELEQEALDDLE